jgi:hypothetical protein
VYAIDRGDLIRLAEEIAAANGFADRIVHVRELSTRATLPEKVDVVVGDQIGDSVIRRGWWSILRTPNAAS